jgi:hypothetical protein
VSENKQFAIGKDRCGNKVIFENGLEMTMNCPGNLELIISVLNGGDSQQRIAELEGASSGPTYDDACETISDGLNCLMSALGIDGDDWGDDIAHDCVIANILKRMAINLEPMGIRPNDDDQRLELPAKQESKLLTETHFPDLDENLAKLTPPLASRSK